jgi:hypothetical protein
MQAIGLVAVGVFGWRYWQDRTPGTAFAKRPRVDRLTLQHAGELQRRCNDGERNACRELGLACQAGMIYPPRRSRLTCANRVRSSGGASSAIGWHVIVALPRLDRRKDSSSY